MSTLARPAASASRGAAILDRFEQATIVVLWTWLSLRVLWSGNMLSPLLLANETTIVLFVLLRRPSTNISLRRLDWALAFAATLLPLLIDPSIKGPPALAGAGVALFVLGTACDLWAKFVLRRSFGIAPANRGVKSSGPYSSVRHPMYLGYFASQVGILMLMPSVFNAVLYAVSWALQVARLLREEELLMRDPQYREYAARVPYRVIPRVF